MAWDDTKTDNTSGLSATEWNDHVTDQKTRLTDIVQDTTPQLGGELDAGAHSIGFTLNSLTSSTNTAVDWRISNKAAIALTSNATVTFTAPSKPCTVCLRLTQDTTGSRTVTWPTIKWQGGTAPTLTTTTSKSDIIAFFYDGTSYYGLGSLNF
jgi:hypothetical protein